MRNATIYSASPQKLNAISLNKLSTLTELESDGGIFKTPTWFYLKFGDLGFRLNVMPKSEISEHIKGFAGYALFSHKNDPISNLEEVLSYIGKINQVYGLVADQEFDFESRIWSELKGVARVVHGNIFVCDSFIDTEGLVIFGPLGKKD